MHGAAMRSTRGAHRTRHASVHSTPAWKHSQYFLRQPLFLQWQPLLWRAPPPPSAPPPGAAPPAGETAILGRNASGLRSNVASIASLRVASWLLLLLQLWQLQLSQ